MGPVELGNLRGRSASGATEGIGLDAGDGTYDVAFFRRLPQNAAPYPMRPAGEDAMLLVVRKDGSGAVVLPDRQYAVMHTVDRGNELELDGPGGTRTVVRLDDGAQATVTGQLHAVRAMYARFGDVTLVAASTRCESTDLCVGRYDFTHGRGENAGLHGRGTETFVAQSTTASD